MLGGTLGSLSSQTSLPRELRARLAATPTRPLLLPARAHPLGAVVAVYVLHLTLDDLAVVAGCVQDVAVARVHAHVGYGVAVASLLEEEQVPEPQVALRPDLVPVAPLGDRVVRQALTEVPHDEVGEAGAVFLSVRPAGVRRRMAVAG